MKSLQNQYNLIKEGKGHKDVFLKEAKRLYPNLLTNAATFDETVKIFKNKHVISENYIDLQPINSFERPLEKWEEKFKNFISEEEIKVDSKKVSKEVEETQKSNFDTTDIKNLDNQIGQEVLNGIVFESRKNPYKTLDEIRSIVSKNLGKDKLYYAKNAAFGVEGIGYTDDVPGLKLSKTDQMEKVKLNEALKSNKGLIDDQLTTIQKAGEMVTLEAKINAIGEAIQKRQERINMIDENDDLADLINPVKLKEMQK